MVKCDRYDVILQYNVIYPEGSNHYNVHISMLREFCA